MTGHRQKTVLQSLPSAVAADRSAFPIATPAPPARPIRTIPHGPAKHRNHLLYSSRFFAPTECKSVSLFPYIAGYSDKKQPHHNSQVDTKSWPSPYTGQRNASAVHQTLAHFSCEM